MTQLSDRDHTSTRSRKLLVIGTVIATILVSCSAGPPTGSSSTSARTDITIASSYIPTTLDPTIDSTPYSEIELMMDPLFRLSADMKVQPGLAVSWKTIDPTTWELKLRPGVKFQNGDPFTAADVKFNFDRILDPATQSRQLPVFYSEVKSTQVVDDLTIRILTKDPWPVLPLSLSFMHVAPAKYFQSVGSEAFAQKPMGSGPYKFVEWVKGSHITLEANENYWDGAPAIKKVTFVHAPDASTRDSQLLSGDVDLVHKVSPADAARVQAQSDLKLVSTRSMNLIFIGMNTFVKPFDDVRVRQALNYAVDWDSIIKNVLSGFAYRNASSIGALTAGYDPNLKPYPYDPTKAKQLLADAGYPNGFDTTFDGPIGFYNQDKEVSEAVIGDLAKVGVRVKYQGIEFQAFVTKFLGDAKLLMGNGERGRASAIQGFYMFGCNNYVGNSFDFCNRLHLHSKVRGIYYNTPALDQMLDDESVIFDDNARDAKARQIEAYIQQQAPWIFAYDDAVLYGMKKGLQFTARPNDFVDVSRSSWQ
jgi:peptide/nickel transport system substrate-binding protein